MDAKMYSKMPTELFFQALDGQLYSVFEKGGCYWVNLRESTISALLHWGLSSKPFPAFVEQVLRRVGVFD